MKTSTIECRMCKGKGFIIVDYEKMGSIAVFREISTCKRCTGKRKVPLYIEDLRKDEIH